MEHQNKAVRYKIDGAWKWVWYDQFFKDYGPFDTKKMATVLGKEHAANEEKLLRRR